jgi:hypothetical protein
MVIAPIIGKSSINYMVLSWETMWKRGMPTLNFH